MLDHCLSLVSLNVFHCNNLVPFPLPSGDLHRLGILRIGPFSEMVNFEAFQLIFNGIQQLLSLRRLCVYGRLQWDSLPSQLMELSHLTHIYIYDFEIEALPHSLDNRTSLETLQLMRCKRLQHLDFSDAYPNYGICGYHLPSRDAMRHLTKLWNLRIYGCPQLEESCTNQSSANSQWSNISHIPKIETDQIGTSNSTGAHNNDSNALQRCYDEDTEWNGCQVPLKSIYKVFRLAHFASVVTWLHEVWKFKDNFFVHYLPRMKDFNKDSCHSKEFPIGS
ncbi:hypothetical protein H5410_051871 [Solanum commersonii]|uniref:Disease resistance protein n=1 Tax=Solanum commersonii TaxID=4109 RepID=A0A9J5X1S0_SOLCO|nr:hypothetical protein H5410_051871 [Solanum commersonii]